MRKAKRTVSVSGYIRGREKVKAHKRSKPDGIKCNNHSYKNKC